MLTLPSHILSALELNEGDGVTMRIVDGQLHIRTVRDAVRRVQQRLRTFVPEGVSLSDELIADRRAASETE